MNSIDTKVDLAQSLDEELAEEDRQLEQLQLPGKQVHQMYPPLRRRFQRIRKNRMQHCISESEEEEDSEEEEEEDEDGDEGETGAGLSFSLSSGDGVEDDSTEIRGTRKFSYSEKM